MGAEFEDRADFENADRGLVAGTEGPAEMNFLFPDKRVLCLAENATHNLPIILTLRGASATVHADVSIGFTRPQLLQMLTTGSADGAAIDGDAGVLSKLVGLLDEPDPTVTVVTP